MNKKPLLTATSGNNLMKTERKNEHYLALQQAFDAPWPGPVGELVTLEKGNIHLQIYPHDGARITSLKAFGSEVLRQWQPQRRAFQYGCFPMVPWAGRLGNATLNAGGQCYSFQLAVHHYPLLLASPHQKAPATILYFAESAFSQTTDASLRRPGMYRHMNGLPVAKPAHRSPAKKSESLPLATPDRPLVIETRWQFTPES